MARIEWVKHRLDNWALWHARMKGDGLGFSSTSSFLREVDSSRYREAWIPVDDVDAGITDQGVAAMKMAHQHLFDVLSSIYLADLGVSETSRQLGRAESTIHSNLGQADAWLAGWFSERKRQQEASRAAFEKKLQAARGGFTT